MQTTGVYKIENISTGQFYIGASTNMKVRWMAHIRNLNANCHISKDLQADWSALGKDQFVFSVLEVCDEATVFERERHWINELNAETVGYNAILGRPSEMIAGRRVNIYLDTASRARAAELGGGNVSEGIRLALTRTGS